MEEETEFRSVADALGAVVSISFIVDWQLLSHVLCVYWVRSVWGECTVSIAVADAR